MNPIRLFERAAAALTIAVLAAAPAAAQAPAKRLITENDLMKFVWIADPQISHDGAQIAFVRVTANEKRDDYDTAIWLVPANGAEPARQLTAGPRDSNPRFSRDGKILAFTRVAEAAGRPTPPQIYFLPMWGGEPQAVTDLPRGAGPAVFSPDGKTVAFTSTTTDDDIAKKKNPPKEPAKESDVRVITRAVYRANGGGYNDPTRRNQIWTLTVSDGVATEPKRLTSDEFGTSGPVFSTDGARVYFTSTHIKEQYYEDQKTQVWSIPVAGGAQTKVVDLDGGFGGFTFSRDGKQIAYIGSLNTKPVRSYDQSDVFVADSTATTVGKNLTTAFDFDIGAGLAGDQRSPRGGSPGGLIWSSDGSSLLVRTAEHGRANLKLIDATTGAVKPLTNGDQEVMHYTASADAKTIAAVISNGVSVGDLFTIDVATGSSKRVTTFNDKLFAELDLTAPEDLWYTSFDGRKIHTLVQKPPNFDATKKYPVILNIHGGPHAAYGHTFFHEMQWMAAKGYIVLYPNPRGSTSYGQDFGNIIQHRYPGDDSKDLLIGVDELVKRGLADPARLGVTGGSGGGVLTNWIITRDHRFKAAVSQRSISDWAGFWYTADFWLSQPTWFKGAPWEDPKDFAARSAITFVGNVKTPSMFVEGEDDLRTPPSDGGEQMFRALKYRKIPTVMVRFPGETHDLSRSGKPMHRLERLRHIMGWFDKWILGASKPEYDVP